jgi:formyltetrahydrofolate deformylase
MSPVERSRRDRHLLTVSWPSTAGQVAAISGFLDLHGCYIIELAQFDDELTPSLLT